MSGMAFASKGGPGPATQTVWFGAIIDRLNMLMPDSSATGAKGLLSSTAPANLGNQWNVFNSSFGATTTAPDGTTNAKLLVEDTSNNIHYCQACSSVLQNNLVAYGVLRFAAFFKQGGRTRVGFQMSQGGTQFQPYARVIFDLAGAQVGVPFTLVTSNGNTNYVFKDEGAGVISYPNGWYLCYQDVYWQDGGGFTVKVQIFTDAGSGTGAFNGSYTGNGSSGIYIWRTNCMPAAAYSIGSTSSFDDFTSASTIDVNATQAPGFKWYNKHSMLNYNGPGGIVDPFPKSQISVAGSVLTLTGSSDSSEIALTSATEVNAAAGTWVVGQSFSASKPLLLELKASWDYTTHNPALNAPLSWWTTTIQYPLTQGQGSAAAIDHGREFDMMEGGGNSQDSQNDVVALAYAGISSAFGGPQPTGLGAGKASWGYPSWNSTFSYSPNNLVISGGVVYVGKTFSNLNHPPPDATNWTPLVNGTDYFQPAASVDYTQMHLYSHLIIPFWAQPGISKQLQQQQTWNVNGTNNPATPQDDGVGVAMLFFDGAMVYMTACWGPNILPNTEFATPSTFLFLSDYQDHIIFLAPGGTTGAQFNIDSFRAMQ